eukprot:g7007.t1
MEQPQLYPEQERVPLADGSSWDRQRLYLAALELDPSYAVAYNNLALTLTSREKVQGPGGIWDRKSLHQKALELDPRHICAYRDLALALIEKDRIFLQALQLDPEPVTCALLGAHLGSGACHLKGSGRPAAREVAGGAKTRQLLLRAAGCGSGEACGRLALLMAPKERATWRPKRSEEEYDSGEAACELVDDAQLWLELSLELAPFERVTLRGEIYDARALCREALQLDPSHPGALRQLQAHQAGSADAIPRPLLLMLGFGIGRPRHAVPDLFEGGCSDWQEPSFAPSDAPQELDAFVLALGKMEQAQAEPDILGECLGPSERVRLSSGDGWHYRSRSQLHKAALESKQEGGNLFIRTVLCELPLTSVDQVGKFV